MSTPKTYPNNCPFCFPDNPAKDMSHIREAHWMGFVVYETDDSDAIHEKYHPPAPRRYRLPGWVFREAHNLKAATRILGNLDLSINSEEAERDRHIYRTMQKLVETRSCTGSGMVLEGYVGTEFETAPIGVFVDFENAPWPANLCRDCGAPVTSSMSDFRLYARTKWAEKRRLCIHCDAYRARIPSELAIKDIISTSAKHMRRYTALMLKAGERYSDDEIIRGCASIVWGYYEVFGWMKWEPAITARFVASESLKRAVTIHRELIEARKLGRLDQLELEWALEEAA